MKNKLGVTYSLFSGEELLKDSILSIRKQVDYINVVWQEQSWTGKKANPEIEKMLTQYQQEGLIDSIIKFEFDLRDDFHGNAALVVEKKNLGLNDLKKAKCTHALLMDVDEFYKEEEFELAKKYIYENKITHSACSIFDYRVLPIYRMRDVQTYAVPFIFKILPSSKVCGRNDLPCVVDPLRTTPFVSAFHKFYYLNMINMHHMTGVRKDFYSKTDNTISNYYEAGRKNIEKYVELQSEMERMSEEEILNSGYIKVDDCFNIMNEWKD